MASRHPGRWAIAAAVTMSVVIAGCSSSSGNDGSGAGNNGSSAGANAAVDTHPAKGVSKNMYGGEQYTSGKPTKGGVLKVGTSIPVATLDPAQPVGSSGLTVDEAIYSKLMTADKNGDAVPQLAKSLTSSDNGATWTLTLPAGLKFSDGTPFDANAVITYFKQLAAPKSTSLQAGSMREIKSMSAKNPQTVVMTLKSPDVGFSSVFTTGSPAMVPSPTAVAKLGDQFGLHPVGAGPFKVKSFQPNGTVDVVRNPGYIVPGRPYVDEIQFIPTPDDSARLQGVRSGSLDVGPIGTAADYAAAQSAGLTVLRQPSDSYYGLLLNLTKPPFNNLNFRTAVIEAINLDGLNKAAFGGSEAPTAGLVATSNPNYTKVDWPTYNPSDAQKLVKEYTSSTGKPASFQLIIPNPSAFSKLASVLQQMLKQAGIQMKYSVSTPQVMVTSVGAGTYQAQMRPQEIGPNIAASVADSYASNSAYNQGLAGDPALDALIAQSRTASSAAQRSDIYKKIQVELAKWRPQIPLVTMAFGFYIGHRVGGFPGGIIEQRPSPDLFDTSAVWLKK